MNSSYSIAALATANALNFILGGMFAFQLGAFRERLRRGSTVTRILVYFLAVTQLAQTGARFLVLPSASNPQMGTYVSPESSNHSLYWLAVDIARSGCVVSPLESFYFMDLGVEAIISCVLWAPYEYGTHRHHASPTVRHSLHSSVQRPTRH